MSTHMATVGSGDQLDLSQADFERSAAGAKSGWCLNLDSAKLPLIKSRLSKRLRALSLCSFSAYCDLIEANDEAEASHFVMSLTTNETNFYREIHHFDFLEKQIIPDLVERAKAGNRVRFWSAGCSSGQEPYSLAASILKADVNAAKYDLKILASDIDLGVLEKAKKGIYAHEDCSCPSKEHEARLFSGISDQSEKRSVLEKLRPLIAFRQLNLVDKWPFSGKFDVIMCRNVAIYFDKPTQVRLWSRFRDSLVPQGHLFIGHSERIADPDAFGLEVAGTTTYRLNNSKTA